MASIDVSKFFSTSDALLKPQSTVESVTAGGGAALTSTCATSASIVCPFGAEIFGGPAPKSLFMNCESRFKYPTGADMDKLQGLWCSRGRPTDLNGVVLLNLSQVPPMGQDGTVPITTPAIAESTNTFAADDIVIRELPHLDPCPNGADITCENIPPSESSKCYIHAISTWSINPGGNLICPTIRNTNGTILCGTVPTALCGTCSIINTTTEPFAIDVVRTNMPTDFGCPEDIIFSDRNPGGAARIRRGITPSQQCNSSGSTVCDLKILTGVIKVWGLALGDFNGAGTFAAYFVAESANGYRDVKKLVKDPGSNLPCGTCANPPATYSFTVFSTLPVDSLARAIAFDPVSGYLFVSEDTSVSQSGGDQARIWRIGPSGTFSRELFGKRFNKPNGIAFHPSGVMLVAEEAVGDSTKGNVLAVGGWRTLFKRGDANGSGVVDISDPIAISNWLNDRCNPAKALACWDGGDANDDSLVDGTDRNYILDYLFSGGPAPLCPGPNTCGRDPTQDLLDCTASPAGCAVQCPYVPCP
jgi:hypothetical protein